jgi:hypothetical protein
MRDIPPPMLMEVLAEIEAEQGHPEKYSVPIEEVFTRLLEKGYLPNESLLH